jgi:hypothetical protein
MIGIGFAGFRVLAHEQQADAIGIERTGIGDFGLESKPVPSRPEGRQQSPSSPEAGDRQLPVTAIWQFSATRSSGGTSARGPDHGARADARVVFRSEHMPAPQPRLTSIGLPL